MTQLQAESVTREEIYSPIRAQSDTCSNKQLLNTRADENMYITSLSAFNPQLSLTEKQILSHALILEVLQKSKKKTVQHEVNRIPIETKLYNVPQQSIEGEFNFNVIPPNNKDYVSTASQKVKEIHSRLSDKKGLAERLNQMAQRNKNKCIEEKAKRASSADNIARRVSISGLVSYSFNSVKARRSLGSIPDQPQEMILARKISQTKSKNTHSVDRQVKMMKRKPNINNMQRIQISKAAICDFHTPTDKFLKMLKKQSQKDEKIYGQRMQKLNCIKQYMEKEKTDYQHAEFIVHSILNSNRKQSKDKQGKKRISSIDDDKELAKRKQALNKKKIMLRYLYFTQ